VRTGLIKLPPPLRDTYRRGLKAYDELSRRLHGVGFPQASTDAQDAMLDASSSDGFAGVPGSTQGIQVPDEAKALYPLIVAHTLHACFALPEYGGNRDRAMWRVAGWDGDTQPLGNTIHDENLDDSELGPGQGHNAGFGDPAVYQPRGGYREHRRVSTPDPGAFDPAVERALMDLLGSNG